MLKAIRLFQSRSSMVQYSTPRCCLALTFKYPIVNILNTNYLASAHGHRILYTFLHKHAIILHCAIYPDRILYV